MLMCSCIVYGRFYAMTAESSGYDRLAHKTKNVSYLVLTESLLIPDLEDRIQTWVGRQILYDLAPNWLITIALWNTLNSTCISSEPT